MSLDNKLCSMCETEPATTTWGLPVCQMCSDSLTVVAEELAEMERGDPALAELGQRVEESCAAFIKEPEDRR